MDYRDVILELIAESRRGVPGVIESPATFSSSGSFSPGCRSCKSGGWMCVYLGQVCNATCPWCSNHNRGDPSLRVVGGFADLIPNATRDAIIQAASNSLITGISFSGGEPLLRIDDLEYMAASIRAGRKDVYLWCYTNGILLDDRVLRRLIAAGIQEIRVDLAATNYDDIIVEKLGDISELLVATVEVPVIEAQMDRLIAVLPRLRDLKVSFLNLHDVHVERHWEDAWRTIDHRLIFVDPVSRVQRYLPSIPLIHDVMRAASAVAPELHVNECALPNMANQWIGFLWQRTRLQNKTDLDFETYKAENLPKLRKQGLVL